MEQTRRSEPFGTAVAPLVAVGGFRLWRTLMTITDVADPHHGPIT